MFEIPLKPKPPIVHHGLFLPNRLLLGEQQTQNRTLSLSGILRVDRTSGGNTDSPVSPVDSIVVFESAAVNSLRAFYNVYMFSVYVRARHRCGWYRFSPVNSGFSVILENLLAIRTNGTKHFAEKWRPQSRFQSVVLRVTEKNFRPKDSTRCMFSLWEIVSSCFVKPDLLDYSVFATWIKNSAKVNIYESIFIFLTKWAISWEIMRMNHLRILQSIYKNIPVA